MLDKSDKHLRDSSLTISGRAIREAEKLKDKSYISELVAYIKSEKDEDKRDYAYFILGQIAINLNDTTVVQFFINRIDKEDIKKYAIIRILRLLAELKKPTGTDLSPLIEATKSKKWFIRHHAIQALNNTGDSIAEDRLIEILQTTDDPYDLEYAVSVLYYIGTTKSIPYLIGLLNDKRNTGNAGILGTLRRIGKRSMSPIFIEQLEEGKSIETKWAAMEAILEYGDRTAIIPVIKRVKKILSRERKLFSYANSQSEVENAINFLNKYKGENKEILNLFEFIHQKKQKFLTSDELNLLNKSLRNNLKS